MEESIESLLKRVKRAENNLKEAEKELAQSEGKLSALKEQMKQLCGTADIKKAEKILNGWKDDYAKMERKLDLLLNKIEDITSNESTD